LINIYLVSGGVWLGVEIFCIKIPTHFTQENFNPLLTFVDKEKQKKIMKFAFQEDRNRALLGDLLARTVIIQKLKISNTQIIFGYNAYGKPFLQDYPSFHFNLSHSGKWIVCAADNESLGIDVEEIKASNLDVAERCFTAEEYRQLTAIQDQKLRTSFFFDLWTLKESYIKAEGKGFSIPPDSFEIISMNNAEYRVTSVKNDCSPSVSYSTTGYINYFLKSYTIDNGYYKLAICARKSILPDKPEFLNIQDLFKIIA
jgi:4'-phosphopantetheinyl transferase